MNKWQEMVQEFHAKFGQPIGAFPNMLTDPDRAAMRARLIEEEAIETLDALEAGDLTEAADGICDLIYVVIGAAIELGINLNPLFTEVHRSNMSKIPGNLREDGKILKPNNWVPPRVALELKKQCDNFITTGKRVI